MTPRASRNAAAPLRPRGAATSGDVAGQDGCDRTRRHRQRPRGTTLADLALALQRVEGVLAGKEPHHRGPWTAQSVDADTFDVAAHLPVWREARRQKDLQCESFACSRLLEFFAADEHRSDEGVART